MIGVVTHSRVIEGFRRGYPDTLMLLFKIGGQIPVGHQVK